MPQLTDDFGRGEVAIETLLARGAKTAIEGTASLRRDAQRAASLLGDEHRLDRRATDIQQPLACAIAGDAVGGNLWQQNFSLLLQQSAKAARQISHAGEVVLAGTMNPALQLPRSKRLLTQPLHILSQGRTIKIKQIDWHGGREG